MAAPANITTLNFSGKYNQVRILETCDANICLTYRSATQNKVLSDNTDEILKLQGVSWAVRKAAGHASITVTLKHTTEDGVEKLFLKQEGVETSETFGSSTGRKKRPSTSSSVRWR